MLKLLRTKVEIPSFFQLPLKFLIRLKLKSVRYLKIKLTHQIHHDNQIIYWFWQAKKNQKQYYSEVLDKEISHLIRNKFLGRYMDDCRDKDAIKVGSMELLREGSFDYKTKRIIQKIY